MRQGLRAISTSGGRSLNEAGAAGSGRPCFAFGHSTCYNEAGETIVTAFNLEPADARQMPLDELLELSWQTRLSSRPACFDAVYPGRTLPVSVTGTGCSLQCAHCGGKYLEHMVDVQYLEQALLNKNPSSILLSGGCDSTGRVPLVPQIDRVRRILAQTGRHWVNAHPGIVDRNEARR